MRLYNFSRAFAPIMLQSPCSVIFSLSLPCPPASLFFPEHLLTIQDAGAVVGITSAPIPLAKAGHRSKPKAMGREGTLHAKGVMERESCWTVVPALMPANRVRPLLGG